MTFYIHNFLKTQFSITLKNVSAMTHIILLYASYLLITVCLTIWVARTLFRNGRLFLVDIFHGNAELAAAVNNLLLVGFYLINLGYAVYTLRVAEEVQSTRELVEMLSVKIGAIILILGAMHFGNMFVFFKLRKRAIADRNDPTLNIAFNQPNV